MTRGSILLTKSKTGYNAFIPHFAVDKFVLSYLGTALFCLNFLFWKIAKHTKRVEPSAVDLITGRRDFAERESSEDEHWNLSSRKKPITWFKTRFSGRQGPPS